VKPPLRRRGGRPPPAGARLLGRFGGRLDPAVALLFQEPSAGRLVVDRHGRILRSSDALRRMVGAALDLSPGTPLLLLFAEAERDAAWAELAPVLRDQARPLPVRAFSARLAGPGPEPLTVAVTAVPVREADGSASGALLSLRDVSAQARLEAQLAHSQRLQAAGQLAGGVAHDFNNLLTAILGAADAIAAQATLGAEAREDLAQIRASAERGSALTRQLLAFGRRQTLQPRVLAVNAVLTDIAALLRRLLGSRIRLELALEQPGLHVRADPMALDQVLLNLAVNARDAMPQGGVLTLHSGHMTLYRPLVRGPETIPPGRYVMIEVQDSGVGIPPEVLPHIFEPFFTTRREQGGTGLGLATVHGIVRQSDGFLAVESAPGKGTRLRVYLPRWDGGQGAIPRRPAAAAPPSAARPAARPGAGGGVVLLVDDEPAVCRVTARALARHGWQVLSADCAESALALLAATPPPPLAAVVTDLVMPGLDGTALVRAVRERLAAPALPAILVSGYAAEELRQEVAAALGEGTMAFLPKPYDIAELAARLRAATARAAAPFAP
jgi:two-component system cell cycle sensor histidine kinase/response regulator CckA